MTRADQWAAERHVKRSLTPLNLATSAVFEACVQAGGHTPSGQYVTRDFVGEMRELPLCQRCGCPYGRVRAWNGATWGAA